MNGREEQFMSELNTRFRSAIVVVGLMLLGSLPSQAATYNFDFTSAFGYSVVGSLTTGNADGSGYDITSISGTIISANPAASGSIQGLVPGNATPPLYLIAGAGSYGNYYYDNIFIPTVPYLLRREVCCSHRMQALNTIFTAAVGVAAQRQIQPIFRLPTVVLYPGFILVSQER